jgi:hypothetical protein
VPSSVVVFTRSGVRTNVKRRSVVSNALEVRMCAVGKTNIVVYIAKTAQNFDAYPSLSRDESEWYTTVRHPSWIARKLFGSTFQSRLVDAIAQGNVMLKDEGTGELTKLRDELIFAWREGNLTWMKAIGKK